MSFAAPARKPDSISADASLVGVRYSVTIGLACWITFHAAGYRGSAIRQSTLDIVERVGGFILSAMAVEMIATGLRSLFPVLLPV